MNQCEALEDHSHSQSINHDLDSAIIKPALEDSFDDSPQISVRSFATGTHDIVSQSTKAFEEAFPSAEVFESLSQDPKDLTLFDVELPDSVDTQLISGDDLSQYANQTDLYGPRLAFDLPFQTSQIGYKGFKDIIKTGTILRDEHGNQVRTSNSPFSDHLSLVEQLLSQKWQKPVVCRRRDPQRCVWRSKTFICKLTVHLVA